jgi:hypothetical protein
VQSDHLRQSYQGGGQNYRGTQDGAAPYVVRGFSSTAGTLGGGSAAAGSGGYAVGSAPLSGYSSGNPAVAMYGGGAGIASVQVTPQQTPQLQVQQAALPRRSLTQPDLGVSNDGWDNENSDLILAVGDVLVNTSGDRCAPCRAAFELQSQQPSLSSTHPPCEHPLSCPPCHVNLRQRHAGGLAKKRSVSLD